MIEQYLWITGSLIFVILGTVHLVYTFFTDKFSSGNEAVINEMKNSFPKLTKETTIWKAWVGFNASHSAGAIFIGLVNIILAVQYFSIMQSSVLLSLLNVITVLFYLWLGKKYWFKIPFMGILITACCFITATLITFLR